MQVTGKLSVKLGSAYGDTVERVEVVAGPVNLPDGRTMTVRKLHYKPAPIFGRLPDPIALAQYIRFGGTGVGHLVRQAVAAIDSGEYDWPVREGDNTSEYLSKKDKRFLRARLRHIERSEETTVFNMAEIFAN